MTNEELNRMLELVRSTEVKTLGPEETLDFELGFIEGQNEMLDRVVATIERELKEADTKAAELKERLFQEQAKYSACMAQHKWFINAEIEFIADDMEAWKWA